MPKSYDWRMLPDLFLSDVMLMVGIQSLESLHRCRQVGIVKRLGLGMGSGNRKVPPQSQEMKV